MRARKSKHNTITQAEMIELLKKAGGKDYWFYVDYDKMYKETSKTYLVIPCSSDDTVLKFYSLEIVALFLNTSVKEVKESLENGTELNGYCIDEAI